MIAATKWGMGLHFEDLNLVDYVYATKLFVFAQIFAVISIAIAKTSFCVTLLRLANSKWQTFLIWSIIITVNLFIWLAAIFVLVSCNPVAKTWDPSIPGTCWDFLQFHSFGIFIGVYSAFTDFLLALFPWVLVWHLRMRRLEKAGICIAMSMGVLYVRLPPLQSNTADLVLQIRCHGHSQDVSHDTEPSLDRFLL